MAPQWSDVLRCSAGTRLRIEFVLEPAVREAIERASTRARGWLRALDGATLRIEQVTPIGCALRLEAPGLAAELSAASLASGGYAVRARVKEVEPALSAEGREIWLQTGAERDSYLACDIDGKRVQVLRLRHAADGSGFGVAVFTGAFVAAELAGRLLPGVRAWLPSLIDVAQLRVLHAGVPR